MNNKLKSVVTTLAAHIENADTGVIDTRVSTQTSIGSLHRKQKSLRSVALLIFSLFPFPFYLLPWL
jgi:hypothetical protein